MICFKYYKFLFIYLKSSNKIKITISPRDNEHDDVLRNYTDDVIFTNKFVMSRVWIHLTWTLKYLLCKMFYLLGRKPIDRHFHYVIERRNVHTKQIITSLFNLNFVSIFVFIYRIKKNLMYLCIIYIHTYSLS